MGWKRKVLLGPLGDALYRKHRRGKRRDKKAARKQERMQKRMSRDKYFKKEALNEGQNNLLNFLSDYGKGIKGLSSIKDDDLYKAGKSNLLDLLSNNSQAYEQFKAPTMAEFNREITPEIANRYSMHGAQRSSSFQNALSDAGGQLGLRLGALRAGLQQSAIPQALQYAQQPIQNEIADNQLRLGAAGTSLGTSPYVHFYRPPTFGSAISSGGSGGSGSLFGNLFGAGATAAGGAIGAGIGGPIGGAIGSGLGNVFSRLFT